MSFFWQKGFYLNGQIYFYSNKPLNFFILEIFGISYYLLNLFILRWENFHLIRIRFNEKRPNNLSTEFYRLKEGDHYILNHYLLLTLPVLVNLKSQYRFNINFWFLTKTFKGLSFKNNKPYRRRSRAKTFLRGTPRAHLRKRMNVSLWFKIINVTWN